MDKIRCMEVVVAVARTKSFTGAARHLGMSKASVTKHVAWFEQHLGVLLFNRTTTQVALTEAGTTTLASAASLLKQFEEMESRARETFKRSKGIIRVGTPPSFGADHFVKIVTDFIERNAGVEVVLFIDTGTSNLISQGLDLSLRIGPPLNDSSYVVRPLTKAPQALVASPEYLRKFGTPLVPSDLVKHNCLIHSLKAPTGIWRFRGRAGETSVRVRGSLMSNFGEALRSGALLGHGISIHPIFMVYDDIVAGNLVPVLEEFQPVSLDIYVVYPSRQSLPVRVRALVQFLRQWAKQPPPWVGLPPAEYSQRRRRKALALDGIGVAKGTTQGRHVSDAKLDAGGKVPDKAVLIETGRKNTRRRCGRLPPGLPDAILEAAARLAICFQMRNRQFPIRTGQTIASAALACTFHPAPRPFGEQPANIDSTSPERWSPRTSEHRRRTPPRRFTSALAARFRVPNCAMAAAP